MKTKTNEWYRPAPYLAGANGKLTVSLGLTKRLVVVPGGIGVGRQDASYPIHMASGAYVTAGRVPVPIHIPARVHVFAATLGSSELNVVCFTGGEV